MNKERQARALALAKEAMDAGLFEQAEAIMQQLKRERINAHLWTDESVSNDWQSVDHQHMPMKGELSQPQDDRRVYEGRHSKDDWRWAQMGIVSQYIDRHPTETIDNIVARVEGRLVLLENIGREYQPKEKEELLALYEAQKEILVWKAERRAWGKQQEAYMKELQAEADEAEDHKHRVWERTAKRIQTSKRDPSIKTTKGGRTAFGRVVKKHGASKKQAKKIDMKEAEAELSNLEQLVAKKLKEREANA